ncbi:MAG: M15 family metallopeptidase [Cyanobacterium sp.]
MKFLRSLFSNFQFINFFLASLIVVLLFSWIHLSGDSMDNSGVIVNSDKSSVDIVMEEILPDEAESVENLISPPSSDRVDDSVENETQDFSVTPDLPPPLSLSTPQPPSENVDNSLFSMTSFGHFPYAEAPQERLVNMGKYYNRTEFLDQEAATAFRGMKEGAKSQGIDLVLISGFRSVASQTTLFGNQVGRRGSAEAAAKVSAPPGYSEHHTGYALDMGDGKQPNLDLKPEFESSGAGQWLLMNAHQYGFEMSFPRNNRQGVTYEPWHWRFVGSPRASEIFNVARQFAQN